MMRSATALPPARRGSFLALLLADFLLSGAGLRGTLLGVSLWAALNDRLRPLSAVGAASPPSG